MAWDTSAPIGSATSPYYRDQYGNIRVKQATSPNAKKLDLQTRDYGTVSQSSGSSSSGSSSGSSSTPLAHAPQTSTSTTPWFPKAPKAPAVRVIPDPDSKRIKVAEERALARRKKGRFSTILHEKSDNKLN